MHSFGRILNIAYCCAQKRVFRYTKSKVSNKQELDVNLFPKSRKNCLSSSIYFQVTLNVKDVEQTIKINIRINLSSDVSRNYNLMTKDNCCVIWILF